jgi:hypothetical protein
VMTPPPWRPKFVGNREANYGLGVNLHFGTRFSF